MHQRISFRELQNNPFRPDIIRLPQKITSHARMILLALLSLPAILFFLIPIIALIRKITFGDVQTSLATGFAQEAILLSAQTTAITTVITLCFGTPLAFFIARKRTWLTDLLDSLIDLPTVLPPAVAGIALLVAFGRRGMLGPWLQGMGIEVAFTSTAVILAQAFVAAPFYIRMAVTAFSQVNRELELAAALDGASPLRIFWAIILPLTWPQLVSGALMTWARALGEFGATIIFASNYPGRTQTIPLAIYLGFESDLTTALTLSVILLVIAFGTLALLKGILRPYSWHIKD